MTYNDLATGSMKSATVSVEAKAKFEGVASLDELKAGDEIEVNGAHNPATGDMEAKSIEKVETRSESQERPLLSKGASLSNLLAGVSVLIYHPFPCTTGLAK